MSEAEAATASAPLTQGQPQNTPRRPSKPTYKSWRKKYYKMRHEFHELMNENQKCFETEQKTIRLARRLQEQNDQLLQSIYEVNQSKKLPSKLRYEINDSPAMATKDLEELLEELEDDYLKDLPSNPTKALLALEELPHSTLADLHKAVPVPEEAHKNTFDDLIGYLSPNHETEYLAALDALDGRSRSIEAGPWSNPDKSAAALKNPVSVYNWLKKYQPNVFLNDGDDKNASASAAATSMPTIQKEEKATPRAAPTKVQPKRASVGTRQQVEPHAMDEDEYTAGDVTSEAAANTGSIRGKRKQVEDEAYRPKGGSSRKRPKKASMSNPAGSGQGEKYGWADDLQGRGGDQDKGD